MILAVKPFSQEFEGVLSQASTMGFVFELVIRPS